MDYNEILNATTKVSVPLFNTMDESFEWQHKDWDISEPVH